MKTPRGLGRGPAPANAVRIAFDSRPGAQVHGIGRYARCLLVALRHTAPEGFEIVETHRPAAGRFSRRVELFHTPWMEGAVLRSPCPMVVTLHDLDALTRRSERLRRGGMHARLRQLALQRATNVIVPSEAMAHDALTKVGLERERVVVIPRALDPAAHDIGQPAPGGSYDPAAYHIEQPAPGGSYGPPAHETDGPTAHETGRLAPGGSPGWSWEDVARATWEVYERALSEPPRPFISRPRAASAPLGSS